MIALLTLIVLMSVVRPMVRKMLGIEKASRRGRGAGAADGRGGRRARRLRDAEHGPRRRNREDDRVAKANGQIQAESLERIGDMVKSNPQETVSVLRGWIHER